MRRMAWIIVSLLLAAGCATPQAPSTFTPGPALDGPRVRGGHAIFTREEDPDFLDPALSYGTYTAPIIEAVFRTLIEYADAPGAAGTRLVPELAENLPEVREDGTLYCFKVRRDARFSAPLGRHVVAADFKYAMERLYRVGSPGCNFYRSIVGVKDVLAGKDSVIHGIIARGDSLYFRLEQPDPIFLSVLAMSFTAAVPREIADRHPNDFSQHTVATGPYRVAEFVPRRRVLLVRNPDYVGTPAWLDTFELKLGVSPINAIAQIRRGKADGGFFEIPPGAFARLRSDAYWSQQVMVADGINTEFLFMNTRVKPFDDVRVRQAVNWAIDRRALMKVYSGKAVVATEFLPPSMPGYAPGERYQAPDRDRARALLREAGYPNGFETRLYGWTTEPGPRLLTVVQQQLAEVGIRASLDLGEAAGYTTMAGNVSKKIPFGIYGWYADYLDPSNFFDPLLSGSRIQPIHNNNLSVFDDQETNAMIARAMSTTDDSVRFALWRRIDRRVMEPAPVATMLHLQESRFYGARLGGWYRHVTRLFKIESLYLKPRSTGSRPDSAAGKGAA